jgi:hypothetical protein
MALQTTENATFAANRTAIVFSRLPVCPAFFPDVFVDQVPALLARNQANPGAGVTAK